MQLNEDNLVWDFKGKAASEAHIQQRILKGML